MIRSAGIVLASVLSIFLAPDQLTAWGCEGHEVVAYIAEREMNPTALSMANTLMAAFPIKIHRACTATVGKTPMSDAATWADDVRSLRPNTRPWHFIDVPLSSAGDDPGPWCKGTCVLTAIQNQFDVLMAAGPNNLAKAEALRFIIHFVGDVHQPLHAITNTDRGGNCVPLAFNGKPRLSNGSYSPELHGIWDTQLVVELTGRSNVNDGEALAQLLDKEITPAERAQWMQSMPVDWAIESSKAAAAVAYTGLTGVNGASISAAQIAGSEVSGSCDLTKENAIVALGIQPNQAYRDAGDAAVEDRLKRAGIRLAKLLNTIWPDATAVPHLSVHAPAGP